MQKFLKLIVLHENRSQNSILKGPLIVKARIGLIKIVVLGERFVTSVLNVVREPTRLQQN